MTIQRLREILKSFSEDHPIEITDIINHLEEENKILRSFLWLNHGCKLDRLYGDDGEMQCSYCFIDFKRGDVKKLIQSIYNRNKNTEINFGKFSIF